MITSLDSYSVGPLLYCPANNEGIACSLIQEKFGSHYSLALCLEDTIQEYFVAEAENSLITSIQQLYEARQNHSFFLPKIFIRVRRAAQIPSLLNRMGNAGELITGLIIPKFCLEQADEYIQTVTDINQSALHLRYIMPILEHPSMIHLQHRNEILYGLKEKLDLIQKWVLNIRVGGNDLCHAFGFRRHSDESIHQIRPIADIFSDIITVYGMDYIISGPVWEYYNGNGWNTGLCQEIKDDRLCGFIGKTVIHPKQIALVNSAYQVAKTDLDDAKAILNWKEDSHSLVSGSIAGERMNECKTHSRWALKTILLAQAYGICPSTDSTDAFL